jgi:regulatory protein
MQAALAMLARRSQPVARIRERLVERFGSEAAEHAVTRLLELRMLDDAAFAEQFVRDRFERAGYGRERIRADLRARNLAAREIQTAIASVIDEPSERAHAARALERFRRKRGRARRASGPEEIRRTREAAFRHLVNRGFPVELVRELLCSAVR